MYGRLVGFLFWGCVFSLFGLGTLAGAPGPETLPQPGTSRTAWMSPMKTPDGGFLAWRITKREEDSTVQELRGKFSGDDCRTWSEEQVLGEIPLEDKGTYHTGLGLLERVGVMHVLGLHYYGLGPKGFHGWEDARSLLYHMMSADGGKTWSQPQHADFGYLYTGALNSLVQLKSGRILAPISYYSKRMTGDFIGKLSISDNGGKTWRPSRGEVVVDTGGCSLETGASEPVCIQLEAGRIWMLIRAQDGYLHESFSTDDGETWSEPAPSRFLSSNAPAALLRLRDGRLVVAWNNSTGPRRISGIPISYARRVLTVALSDDEGKTWNGYREVARDVEYPALNASSDGAILVYSRKFKRVSTNWLMEKSFSDHFQKGLQNWYTQGCEGVEAITHPDRPDAKVLAMRKPKVKVPAGASLNFPFGVRGTLSMRIRMNRNDNWINRQHYYFCLTDFFCMPRMPDVGPGSGQFETGCGGRFPPVGASRGVSLRMVKSG